MRTRTKVFIGLSAVLGGGIIVTYVHYVRLALSYPKDSYECTQDSLTMSACQHPFTNSLVWTAILVGYMAGPLVVAWLFSLVYVIAKRRETKKTVSSPENES